MRTILSIQTNRELSFRYYLIIVCLFVCLFTHRCLLVHNTTFCLLDHHHNIATTTTTKTTAQQLSSQHNSTTQQQLPTRTRWTIVILLIPRNNSSANKREIFPCAELKMHKNCVWEWATQMQTQTQIVAAS